MQQRARRCQPQLALVLVGHGPQLLQRRIQVGAPDVAAVHDAHRQHLVRRQPVGHAHQLVRGAHGVHMQAGHGQLAGQAQVLGQGREVGGQQQLGRAARQLPVAGLKGMAPGVGQVQAQDGLVDLHPFHALGLQACQHGFVHRQQRLQQAEAVKARRFGFAQPQKAQRPQQHGLDAVAQRLGLGHLGKQALAGQVELGVGAELGHEVVVVGVEPLGHLQCGLACGVVLGGATGAAACVVRCGVGRHAPCHCKVAGQLGRVGIKAKTCRLAAQQLDVVGHMVVQRKVAHGHTTQARIGLRLPVLLAQLGGGGLQIGLGAVTAPEGFEREFQRALRPHARKAQGVREHGAAGGWSGERHGDFLLLNGAMQ